MRWPGHKEKQLHVQSKGYCMHMESLPSQFCMHEGSLGAGLDWNLGSDLELKAQGVHRPLLLHPFLFLRGVCFP